MRRGQSISAPRGRGASSAPRRAPPAASTSRATRSATTRSRAQGRPETVQNSSAIPSVYQEMLSEFYTMSKAPEVPQKRKRVGQRPGPPSKRLQGEGSVPASETASVVSEPESKKPVQTTYDVDVSSDEDEEDIEWEDVAIAAPPPSEPTAVQEPAMPQLSDLQITFQKSEPAKKPRSTRKKAATAAERRVRLAAHKMHLLCLLSHVSTRNSWCNDEALQRELCKLLPSKCRSYLRPSEGLSQFARSTTFADGLKQALEIFHRKFKVVSPGMKRAYWVHDFSSKYNPTGNNEVITSAADMLTRATTMQGSRDLAAQLFCAMLRGVGVEARLVCSLQVLPFSGEAKVHHTDASLERGRQPDTEQGENGEEKKGEGNDAEPPTTGTRRLARPRLNQVPTPRAGKPMPTQSAPRLGRGFSESKYPVFWVEAFNEAMQKWVSVDPMVTRSINKPLSLEPPASDALNSMCYVVAFEDDLSARDVTRRYAKSYYAKNRKLRVESTPNGTEWWDRVMEFFEKPFPEDRDQIELSEFAAKAAAEPMPRNIQDFKDHPIYALERHLRRNEVIHPKKEIGKVSLSKLSLDKKTPKLEPVYRRANVHTVRSAEGWYRLGREVKIGEQPLKRVKPAGLKAVGNRESLSDFEGEEEQAEVSMYAEFQTQIYTPPPVVDNKVIKNAYGNIDVYVPSMVPAGGFHLKHPEAARAARLLGIDYADAVTGFDFKGRRGTAVTQGIVASEDYREALDTVLQGFEENRIWEENERRRQTALGMWKLMLTKLRIEERVKGYFGEDDMSEEEAKEEEDATEEQNEDREDREEHEEHEEDFENAGGWM